MEINEVKLKFGVNGMRDPRLGPNWKVSHDSLIDIWYGCLS